MKSKREANWYDKIFKENIEAVTMALIEKVLHIQVAHAEKLQADLPKNIERKPDQLLQITDVAGSTFILHLEFQVIDEPDMVYRMFEYRALLSRKYKLDVHQYVLFLSDEQPEMTTQLTQRNLAFTFDLICFSQIDYALFLRSSQAEEVVFAILGNFGTESPQVVAQKLVSRLQETSQGQLALEKHLEQLRILANLRKLKPFLEQIMESITKYFKPEEDFLYKKGEQLGLEKGEKRALERQQQEVKAMIQRFLKEGLLTTQQIAIGIGVPETFVEHIKAEMER